MAHAKSSGIEKGIHAFIGEPNEFFTLLGPFYYERLLMGKASIYPYAPEDGINSSYVSRDCDFNDQLICVDNRAPKRPSNKPTVLLKKESKREARARRIEKEVRERKELVAEKQRLSQIEDEEIERRKKERLARLDAERQKREAIEKERSRIEYTIANRYVMKYSLSTVGFKGQSYKLYYVIADCDVDAGTVDIILYFYADSLVKDTLALNGLKMLIEQYAHGNQGALDRVDKNLWNSLAYRMPIDMALGLRALSREFMTSHKLAPAGFAKAFFEANK